MSQSGTSSESSDAVIASSAAGKSEHEPTSSNKQHRIIKDEFSNSDLSIMHQAMRSMIQAVNPKAAVTGAVK